MSDLLPPLQAVKVFDAVARHQNFTKAAAELNMTQSAVSYQIKALEAFIGAPLFTRQARGVVLNERGTGLAPQVRQALSDLAQSFRRARDENSTLLVITTLHTFASTWLAPRIGSFQLAHPEIAVRLDISSRVADIEAEGIDVALRHGKGDWPGLVSHFLFEAPFVTVCSPHYIEREGKPESPQDLARRGVLISPADDWWPLWFQAAGLTLPVRIERPGIEVATQQLATTLATAGLGIALVTLPLVEQDIAAGRLVRLFDVTGSAGSNYYLLYAESRRLQKKTRLFRDWILAEAAISRQTAA